MSKILRRGIRTGFIILSLLIFGAVFTGWDIFLQNYNNRSRVTPILAVFVLLMGIILWETNGRRTDREARICGNRTRTDRIIKWSSVIIFAIQIFLFWNIFFKTGWDVAVIENGARVLLKNDGSSEWLSEYFSVYPNNILLTWFYCFTLWIADIFGMSDTENVQMIFIICNSAISCITAYHLLLYEEALRDQTGGAGIYFLRYKYLYVTVGRHSLFGSAYGIHPRNDSDIVYKDRVA